VDDDVDAAYKRALRYEAASVREPNDLFYGNREAGIRDPHGNTWWIAHEMRSFRTKRLSAGWQNSAIRGCD